MNRANKEIDQFIGDFLDALLVDTKSAFAERQDIGLLQYRYSVTFLLTDLCDELNITGYVKKHHVWEREPTSTKRLDKILDSKYASYQHDGDPRRDLLTCKLSHEYAWRDETEVFVRKWKLRTLLRVIDS